MISLGRKMRLCGEVGWVRLERHEGYLEGFQTRTRRTSKGFHFKATHSPQLLGFDRHQLPCQQNLLLEKTVQEQDIKKSGGMPRRQGPVPSTMPNQPLECSLSAVPEAADEIIRPDIGWFPSYKVHQDRVERLKILHPNRPTTLPAGWPAQVDAKRSWSGWDFNPDSDFIFKLTPEDIREIEAGLAFFKALPGDPGPDDVNPETFPLPGLASRLGSISEDVHNGRGFAILRGLDPSRYSPFDNVLLYLGVTSYVAETRGVQDFDGRMLLHIQAVAEDIKKHGSMPNSPYVTRAQPFHTDLCDVLSLYAIDVAEQGGESFLASSGKIYNEIAKTRPDVIHVLAQDNWVFDEFWKGEYHTRPILHNFEGHGPGFQFSRRPLTGSYFSPHHPGVPAMSEIQAEALDMVYFLAKEHAVEIKMQRGDIEIFNNFAMLHARSSFMDGDAGRRHMLRLWLRNEAQMWKVPKALERLSWECYGDHEYRQSAIWDIEKSPPELRVKHRRSSCA